MPAFFKPKAIKQTTCTFNTPNLYLIKHTNSYDPKDIEKYLGHIYTCGQYFGNFINNLNIKKNITIINIPRGGNTLSLGINSVLNTKLCSTNQGKFKDNSKDILDIKNIDTTSQLIIADTIIDTSNTMNAVLSKIYTYDLNADIIIVCVYCTPDGAFNICNLFSRIKLYTFEIYKDMEWPQINKSINKRYLAKLVDAGECAQKYGYII